MDIISQIIENGSIPFGYTYTYFPIHHLLASIATITTNISLSETYHYLGSGVMSLGIIFSFLIGRKFIGIKFGLIAALLFCCSDYLIYWASHPVQLSYMLPLILAFLTVVIYITSERTSAFILLYVILSTTIVFLHHYSAMIVLFMLIGILFSEFVFKIENNEYKLKSSRLLQIFTIMLFAHWMFYSGIFGGFINIFNMYKNAFATDLSGSVVSQTYYDKLPIETILINELGSFILICLSTIGFYYLLRNRSVIGNIFTSIFVIFISLIGIGTIIDVFYLLPNRIYAFMQELSMIYLAALAIIWVLKNRSHRYSKNCIVITIILLQFLSASSTIAGFETSPFVGEQAYWKFYETPHEKNALLWAEYNILGNEEDYAVYLNPGFVVGLNASSKLSPSYDKAKIKNKNDKYIFDLTNLSSKYYIFSSQFDVEIGFVYRNVMDKYHMGSSNKVKMDTDTKTILDNNRDIIGKIYSNEYITIHHK
ncbi:hypothetical protein J7W08_07915 [Methanococcoides orientis]|uniref:hypothetical protein n=1 Tax=Methanococcoides orientis TaxID=2822137 RepID=UPI001E2C1E42|nr:hypothetical protein [Methanococcoides orientis]UGV40037.1 hypothetical protein J7W08_07915 [Methanococcoides orientis]